MHAVMALTFPSIIEILGTLAFAISGIRLASAKRFDWFGAYVVGLITAIGGGTIRDLLLDTTAFWMLNSIYLTVTAVALLLVIIFGRYLIRLNNTFFIFDTIGLALFVVVGIQKTIAANFPFWIAIIMGTIPVPPAGVLRDILINEVPLIFRKEIYAWPVYRRDRLLDLLPARLRSAPDTSSGRPHGNRHPDRRGEIQTQFTSPEGR